MSVLGVRKERQETRWANEEFRRGLNNDASAPVVGENPADRKEQSLEAITCLRWDGYGMRDEMK